ncbi:DUF4358 domain-containing protein [Paenibacillus sp. GYB006]|uniref:DUF4358 domain-containing protein n=1 Tax=Paenibacillus sp. GYB006 TaxID=2994394 RepID=UPI002F963A70
MKKMILMLMTFTMVIAGCGTQKAEEVNEVNVPVSQLMEVIMQKTEMNKDQFFDINLKEDTETAKNLGIDPTIIEEGQYMKAMMNVHADEFIILKASDASNVEELKAALEKEVANQERNWSTYLPEQYEKVKNHIIKQQGNYLALLISDDAEKMEQAFTNALTSESK